MHPVLVGYVRVMADQTVWGIPSAHLWGVPSAHPEVDFIGDSEISIGWEELGDPREIGPDREALTLRLSELYPNEKADAMTAGWIIRFVYEMDIGDLVVYSHKLDETFNIGRITEDYEYRGDGEGNGNPGVRKVEWLRLGEPWASFSLAARAPMTLVGTLCKLTAAADEFQARVENGVQTDTSGEVEGGSSDTDPEGDEAAVASMIPSEHRDEFGAVIVASIRHIDEIAPNAWSLTLVEIGSTIRLNLGNAHAWTLRSGVLGLEVVDDAVPAEVLDQLRADGLVSKWAADGGTSNVTLGHEAIATFWPALRDAHFKYLDQLALADSAGGTPHFKSHRPGLLDALSDLLAEQLPQPSYATNSIAFMYSGRVVDTHGLLAAIAEEGPVSLGSLLSDDTASDLFKPANDHVPKQVASNLIRLTRELGLVGPSSELELTDLGTLYAEAIDASNPWQLDDEQTKLLRSAIQERGLSTGGAVICRGAVLALSLWRTADALASVTLQDFGRALAAVGNGTTWKKPSTFSVQGAAYTNLLKDTGLLSDKRVVTAEGEELLRAVDLPPHDSIADALKLANAVQTDVAAEQVPRPKPALAEIVKAIQAGGLRLSEQTIRRYHLSIESRGFVILAGLSGSGKTQLAKQYAAAVGAANLLVAVAPNWTSNEDLLGYTDPIGGEYVDTEFSRFLSRASAEFQAADDEQREALDYHLILDEMNLARVEYYFAKFLSAMELTGGSSLPTIELGGQAVQLTPNLKFVGTVNVDETTHGFADKVYDRAQLIEIPVDREQIAEHLGGRPYQKLMLALYDALLGVAPFAYRVLDNIDAYVSAASKVGVSWQDATDEQVLQKILPKVKGTDPQIGPALKRIIELTDEEFPLTNDKARRMSDAFRDHGFVSFF